MGRRPAAGMGGGHEREQQAREGIDGFKGWGSRRNKVVGRCSGAWAERKSTFRVESAGSRGLFHELIASTHTAGGVAVELADCKGEQTAPE